MTGNEDNLRYAVEVTLDSSKGKLPDFSPPLIHTLLPTIQFYKTFQFPNEKASLSFSSFHPNDVQTRHLWLLTKQSRNSSLS